MATLQEAFGPRNLNQVVELFRDQSQNRMLTGFFREEPITGELYEWDELSFPRRLAPVSAPDAPSKNIVELAKTHRSTSLCHIKLNKRISGRKVFQMERALGELLPNAEATVTRDLVDLTNSIQKTIEYLCANAFAGSIAVSSANIEGSDVTFTVTFAVQTFTRTTSWATPSTAILSSANEVPNVKDVYSKATGFPLAMLLFNQSVTNYLMGNIEIQAWVQHTIAGVTVMEIGHLTRAGGLDWVEYNGNYQPTGGSVTKFIADGKFIGFPAPADYSQYLVMALGKGMIPKAAIGAAGTGLVGEAPSAGFYSYALTEGDPVVLKVIVGWIGFPIITYPSAIVYGSVS